MKSLIYTVFNALNPHKEMSTTNSIITENQPPYSVKTILWVIFFCYSTFAALVFQRLLLPALPAFHAGSGLINADSLYFHTVAISFAKEIQINGWSHWTIWPTVGATGNVAVLAALYVFFGEDPSLIIPLNAAIHATSGLIIFLIGRLIWPGKVGTYAGIIASGMFVFFPSALNWYAQVHKDGYMILGFLIISYGWIAGLENSSKRSAGLWIIVGTVLGVALIIFVRPYNLKLLLMASICIFAFLSIVYIVSKQIKKQWYILVYFSVSIFIIMIGMSLIPDKYREKYADISQDQVYQGLAYQDQTWQWQRSEWMPDIIERNMERVSVLRVSNLVYSKIQKAGSTMDTDRKPDNVFSAIAYLPRGLQIALLAPFPLRWLEFTNITRLVSTIETFIWYLLIPGVFFTLYYRRTLAIAVIVVLCLFFLTVYGYTMPNLGTLYRIRYVFLFYFILLGSMGWVNYYLRKKNNRLVESSKKRATIQEERAPVLTIEELNKSRFNIANAGTMIMMLTAVSYLLLFVRDVVLARWFGLGSDLDTFFVAMILPMFLVSVLCIPLGIAIIPTFLSLAQAKSKHEVQAFISNISKIVLISAAVISLVLFLLVPVLIPVIGNKFSPETIEQAKKVMFFVIPIFFFSGPLILSNSLLNALKKFAVPSLAQAIVPIVAVLVLLVMGNKIGIYAIAIGMLLGQLINLFIVVFYLRKEGFSLVPLLRIRELFRLSSEAKSQLREMSSQYFPLALSALFTIVVIPVNSIMAASLSSGSLSALSLGNKVILFMTGVIGTGIATVMLPYFSSFVAKNLRIEVRRELSFFLLLATVLAIPVSILIYYMAEPTVLIAFGGNAFTSNDVKVVSRIIEYGIIQLPFFICSILLMKYVTAKGNTKIITVIAVVGLVLNIVLNVILMKFMGVVGIALATTLAMMISTILFLGLCRRVGDISWVEVVMLTLNWLLFLTLILCAHCVNMTGIIISLVSLTFISMGHFKVLFHSTSGFLQFLFHKS
jgi:putative peptidoglycan lipid II flippase